MSALYGRSYAEATLNIGNFDNTTTTNISTIRIISTKMRRLNGSYIPQLMNYVVPRDQLYTFYNYIFYNHYFYINSFHKLYFFIQVLFFHFLYPTFYTLLVLFSPLHSVL